MRFDLPAFVIKGGVEPTAFLGVEPGCLGRSIGQIKQYDNAEEERGDRFEQI